MWIGRKGRAKCLAIERSAQPIDPCSELLHAAGAHAAQPIGAFCRAGDSSGAKRIGGGLPLRGSPGIGGVALYAGGIGATNCLKGNRARIAERTQRRRSATKRCHGRLEERDHRFADDARFEGGPGARRSGMPPTLNGTAAGNAAAQGTVVGEPSVPSYAVNVFARFSRHFSFSTTPCCR